MNKICVVIPVIDEHELTRQCIESIINNATDDIEFLIIDNGSKEEYKQDKWPDMNIVRHPENIGLLPALQEGYELVKKNKWGDIIFFTHNDVLVQENGWDVRVKDVFKDDTGVVGFGGAEGIGATGIYKVPYEKQQLARQHFMSNMIDAEDHGWRREGLHKIAVLDGFSLIMRVKTLNKVGGFDLDYPAHHMYDNDICLEHIKAGYTNYMLGVSCQHFGGRTSTRTVYQDWSKKYYKEKYNEDVENGDNAIHDKAHEVFYEKWRGFLPYWERR